jgi:hypothetical protein
MIQTIGLSFLMINKNKHFSIKRITYVNDARHLKKKFKLLKTSQQGNVV